MDSIIAAIADALDLRTLEAITLTEELGTS